MEKTQVWLVTGWRSWKDWRALWDNAKQHDETVLQLKNMPCEWREIRTVFPVSLNLKVLSESLWQQHQSGFVAFAEGNIRALSFLFVLAWEFNQKLQWLHVHIKIFQLCPKAVWPLECFWGSVKRMGIRSPLTSVGQCVLFSLQTISSTMQHC